MPLAVLQTLDLTTGQDMPDQSRARLHKAIGAVLSESNPGLAEHGPFLPHGLQVELPDLPASTTAQTVQLWD